MNELGLTATNTPPPTDQERLMHIQQARRGPYGTLALSPSDIDFLIEQAQNYQAYEQAYEALRNEKIILPNPGLEDSTTRQKDDHHV